MSFAKTQSTTEGSKQQEYPSLIALCSTANNPQQELYSFVTCANAKQRRQLSKFLKEFPESINKRKAKTGISEVELDVENVDNLPEEFVAYARSLYNTIATHRFCRAEPGKELPIVANLGLNGWKAIDYDDSDDGNDICVFRLFFLKHPHQKGKDILSDLDAGTTEVVEDNAISMITRLHRHPKILALGILLIEIELGTRIEQLRSRDYLNSDGNPNINTDYSTAVDLLNNKQIWDRLETSSKLKGIIRSSQVSRMPNRASPAYSSRIETVLPKSDHAKDSKQWLQRVDEEFCATLCAPINGPKYKPVRIAVLDTGIVPDHFNRGCVHEYKDFTDSNASDWTDVTGHGSIGINLIVKLFPAAEIYVARVFKHSEAEENTPELIVQAICHARDTWKVDIITLASGFMEEPSRVRSEIVKAKAEGILVFAAASNHANMERIAFPARMHGDIMCMFASDGKAKETKRKISPAPSTQVKYNFALLGEDVDVHFAPGSSRRESGTSISTFIGAAVAGVLLDFSKQEDCKDRIRNPLALKTIAGMSAVFAEMANGGKDNGYDCVAPWKLVDYMGSQNDEPVRKRQFGDFNLWASSLRAAEISHASLDYRLRERKDAREVIESLLQCLRSSLTQCYKTSQGHVEILEDFEIVQDDSDESFDSWSDFSEGEDESDSEVDQYQPWLGTPFYEEIQNIAAILDQLSRLGMAIRRAGARFRYANADRSLKKYDHAEFKDYLRAILLYDSRKHQFISYATYKLPVLAIISKAFFLDPGRLTPIQKRMIHANIVRRNRLDYMRKREKRFSGIPQAGGSQTNDVPTKASFTPQPKAPTPEVKDIIKASEPSINQSATQVESRFTPEEALPPPKKAMTAATSKISTTAARVPYPKAPKIEDGRETFQCPYCLHALSRKYAAEKEWKRHVSRDLLPYTCIFEDCETPDEMYLSKDEWAKHLHNSHSLKHWKCPFSDIHAACAKNPLFATENEWITHMETCHDNKKAFTTAQLRVLAKTNITCELPPYHCPICPPHMKDRPHSIDDVAAHLHSFALGALPWVGDPDDEESKATGASSAKRRARGELDSLSSTSSRDSIHNRTIAESFNVLLERLSFMANRDKAIKLILLDLQDWSRDIHRKAPCTFEMIQEDGGELASKIKVCFVDIKSSLNELDESSITTRNPPSSRATREKYTQLHESVGSLTGIKGAMLAFMDEILQRAIDTTNAVREQFRGARIKSLTLTDGFYVPRQVQDQLVTEQNVAIILYIHIKDYQTLKETAKLTCQRGSVIFAILLLMKKESETHLFFKEGVFNNSLPLQRQTGDQDFQLKKGDHTPVMTIRNWDSEDREKFDHIQWWFMAPLFEDLQHYELSVNVSLPTVPVLSEGESLSVQDGGYCEVYPVRIHPMHHNWNAIVDPESKGPLVAIKKFSYGEEAQQEAQQEREILRQLTLKGHPHIIKLLSTFQQAGIWHLMFPFAESNLREYWDNHKIPVFNRQTIFWSLIQIAGMASALNEVHGLRATDITKSRDNLDIHERASPTVTRNEISYCRHGDIKPENLLWFQHAPGLDNPNGILQLADFGLAHFDERESGVRTLASEYPHSPTYEPPEYKAASSWNL
ncbi:hypothetical protein MW887_002491 [Aspergillus wentii]|nr:hypothetical protein MW887_002491 [Aspergillus wentii]